MKTNLLFVTSALLFVINAAISQMSSTCPHAETFWNAEKIVHVKGRFAGNFGNELQKLYAEWATDTSHSIVKCEDELTPEDEKKHLYFFGPLGSYAHLTRYLPSALSVDNGSFRLGSYRFTDSLDAISLYTSDSLRLFQLGNSFTGLQSLWTTMNGISQYLIMQRYAVTHHGSLLHDQFDSSRHFDVVALRDRELTRFETEFYTFHHPPDFFKGKNINALLLPEDKKVLQVIDVLKLEKPNRKIDCFIYNNIEQKYRLSATPGYGNPFTRGWQNHTIGIGATEHESVHILWDNEVGTPSTFFAESVVGYYYIKTDTMARQRDRLFYALHPNVDMKGLLTGKARFNFSVESYAASANFSWFFVETYGLNALKQIMQEQNIEAAFQKVCTKSVDEIVQEWKTYAEQNKIQLGPERHVTFKVIPKFLPDTSVIHLIGEGDALTNWGSGIPLQKQSDGSWTTTVTFREGMILTYKIHRGAWEKEAVSSDGTVPGNSHWQVRGADTISIAVENWKDSQR